MSTPRLSPTSYVVLGLIEKCQPATPYEIKAVAQESVVNFWSLPHTQLYTECRRLAEEGLLDEHQENGGRRRKVYELTKPGLKALDEWRADPVTERYEARDLAILKLFFGGDPAELATGELEAHQAQLAHYAEIAKLEMPDGMRLALEAGMGHEREYIRFWKRFK